ncbi:MAG: cysteine peptidase family C39 domain-containing protein [Pirellula sp.]
MTTHAVALLFAVVAASHATELEASKKRMGPTTVDASCGPRAVRYVLAHYDHRESLSDLVREIQWPNLESGSSLSAMEVCLRRRGIATIAVEIPPMATVDWPNPVLVHCNTESGDGHFLICEPNGRNSLAVRDTSFESSHNQIEKHWQQRSGVVLLTASDSIDKSCVDDHIRMPFPVGKLTISVCVFAIAMFALCTSDKLQRDRRNRWSPSSLIHQGYHSPEIERDV